MFCPKCATQNVDGASFCRSCGANISLVPQALSGQLAARDDDKYDRGSRRKRRREPTLDEGIRHFMMGLAFMKRGMLDFAVKQLALAESELPVMDEVKNSVPGNCTGD